MERSKTHIDYVELDNCITGIQSIIDEPYVSVLLGQLKSKFEYSQSEYVDRLKTQITILEDINSMVNDLLFKSKYMLQVAKTVYSGTDKEIATIIE